MAEERWGQLTYTSFDPGNGSAGGWGIKETAGSLTEAEIQAIQSRIVTSFDTSEQIPQFPSTEEIARLPRKLTYVPLEGSESLGYWHSVPSGLDGVGRPGNVFSHVLLDRRIDDPAPPLRPITLWRSPGWSTPFGPSEALASSIGNAVPSVGSAVNADSVIDFLLDPAVFRGPALTVLLDALSAASRGGKRVIIATDSPDTSALWIGAAVHLMAPRTSREIPFSVFDRPAGVTAALRRGALIVGVAYIDIGASMKLDNVVVLDDRAMPSLGDLGGEPHRVGDVAIPVTEWSVMAEVALQDPALARSVLESIDAVSSQFAGTSLSFAWPLAMAVALMPDGLSDASSEAAAVLRDASPTALRDFPALWAAAAASAQGIFGSSTQQALEQINAMSARPGSVMHDLAVAVYQERVLRDPAWMYGAIPAEAPRASTPAAESLTRRAAEALAVLAQSSVSSKAMQIVRLGDWIVTSGLTSGDDVAIQVSLETLIQEHVIPLLLEPGTGDNLVSAAGPVSEEFVRDWVRPLVNASLGELGAPGSRLQPSVIRWLFPVGAGSFNSELDLEYFVEGIVEGLPSFRQFRAMTWIALADRNVQVDSSPRTRNLTRSDGEWLWSAEDVLRVESRHPGSIPDSVLRAALLAEPSGPALDKLLIELDRTASVRAGSSVLELVFARVLTDRLSRGGIVSTYEAGRCLVTLDRINTNPSWAALFVLVGTSLMGVNGQSAAAFPPSRVELVRWSLTAVDRDAFEEAIQRLADSGQFTPEHFNRALGLVLIYAADCPVESQEGPNAVLGKLSWPGESGPEARLIVIVAAAMARARIADIDSTLDRVENTILKHIPDGRGGDKTLTEFDRFAKTWRKYFRSLDASLRTPRPSIRGLFGNASSQREKT